MDGRIISKPHHSATCGQVLTFPGAKEVRVIRIDALGTRRGPASEAALLYTDLEVPMRVKAKKVSEGALDFETRAPGCGRPTKLQRRKTDRLKRRFL